MTNARTPAHLNQVARQVRADRQIQRAQHGNHTNPQLDCAECVRECAAIYREQVRCNGAEQAAIAGMSDQFVAAIAIGDEVAAGNILIAEINAAQAQQ